MSQLLLIRHGQASFGAANYDRLSELGERQARLTGRHLAELGHRFDVMISGDMARQAKTAERAAEAWDDAPALATHAAFNEYDPDSLFKAYLERVLEEDTDLAAQRDNLLSDRRLFQRVFEQITGHWVAGTPHGLDTFESWDDFMARVAAGLAVLHEQYDRRARIGVFSSGGPIAVAVAQAVAASAENTIQLNWSIYNASISELRSTRHGWRVLGFNDITHLRLPGDGALVTHR